jgi:hypothetical protein
MDDGELRIDFASPEIMNILSQSNDRLNMLIDDESHNFSTNVFSKNLK